MKKILKLLRVGIFVSIFVVLGYGVYGDQVNIDDGKEIKYDITINDVIHLERTEEKKTVDIKDYIRGSILYGDTYEFTEEKFSTFLNIASLKGINDYVHKTFLPRATSGLKQDSKSLPISYCTIFDAKFSPNGKYILFKFGIQYSPGAYRLYIYDIEGKETRLICKEILYYYAVSWSPDSNYVAYAKGGDDADPLLYDFGRNYTSSLELCITNWKSGETQIVDKSRSFSGEWQWMKLHDLIYGRLDDESEKVFFDSNREYGIDFKNGEPVGWERLKGGIKAKPVAPNIYVYSIEERKKRILLKNGYRPVVSQDNKYVAFLGAADSDHPMYLTKNWMRTPNNMSLIVQNIKDTGTSERSVVDESFSNFPTVLWYHNSESLVVIDLISSPKNHYFLDVKVKDILEAKTRAVAKIELNDATQRSFSDPFITSSVLSKDDKMLVLSINEYHENPGKYYYKKEFLKVVNLGSGAVRDVFEITAGQGLDWKFGIDDSAN